METINATTNETNTYNKVQAAQASAVKNAKAAQSEETSKGSSYTAPQDNLEISEDGRRTLERNEVQTTGSKPVTRSAPAAGTKAAAQAQGEE